MSNFHYEVFGTQKILIHCTCIYILLGIPSDQSSGTSSPLCDSGLHLNYHPNNTVREENCQKADRVLHSTCVTQFGLIPLFFIPWMIL